MDDEAVSTLVGFILIVLITITFIGLVQSVMLPQWNKAEEMEHSQRLGYEVAKIGEAISLSSTTGKSTMVSLNPSLSYPERPFLISPTFASATISSEELNVSIKSNKININEKTCAIIVSPNYYYSPKPKFMYEHSASFKNYDDNTIATLKQSSFTNSSVNIYILNTTFKSFAVTQPVNLIFEPISYGGKTFIDSAWINFTVTNETAEWWNETLTEIYGDNVSRNGNWINFSISNTYLSVSYLIVQASTSGKAEINIKREGVKLINLSDPPDEVYKGVTIPLGVEVVDKFYNPIPNYDVDISINSNPVETKKTDEKGEVWYYFDATTTGTYSIKFSIFSDSYTYTITVTSPPSSGGGIFDISWNVTPSGDKFVDDWNVTAEGSQKFYKVTVMYEGNPVSDARVDFSTDAPNLISIPNESVTDTSGESTIGIIAWNNGTANVIATSGGSSAILELTITGAGGVCPAGWSYWREIQIQNLVNYALTDYQILITLDTQSLISAGKMRSDCGDIRFYDEARVNSLSYWIEDGTCDSTNTKIWVKIPSIPASGVVKMYMYYGNPSATSESNIDNVMDVGLRYYYFDGTNFNTFKGTDVDTNVDHWWWSSKVQINGNSWEDQYDTVSIRWEGWVKPAGNGNHIFYIYTDDGSKLWVGGSLIINAWWLQAPREYFANYDPQNQIKSIKYEWFENYGLAVASLGWDPPGAVGKMYPIPSEYLRCKKTTYPDPEPLVTVGSEGLC